MTIDLIVERAPADKQGDDIVDPLITTVAVARERGRNELDELATQKVPTKYRIVYRAGLELGQLVKVVDALFGRIVFGKLTSIRHIIGVTEATTEITIKEEADF